MIELQKINYENISRKQWWVYEGFRRIGETRELKYVASLGGTLSQKHSGEAHVINERRLVLPQPHTVHVRLRTWRIMSTLLLSQKVSSLDACLISVEAGTLSGRKYPTCCYDDVWSSNTPATVNKDIPPGRFLPRTFPWLSASLI